MNLFPIHIRSSYMINYYSNAWQFMSQRLFARQGHKRWSYLNKNVLRLYIFLCVFWGTSSYLFIFIIFIGLISFNVTIHFIIGIKMHCRLKLLNPEFLSKFDKQILNALNLWRSKFCRLKLSFVLSNESKNFLSQYCEHTNLERHLIDLQVSAFH